jgi:hypothetical protein
VLRPRSGLLRGLSVGLQADGGTLGRHRRRAEARPTQGARVDFRRSPVPRAKGFGVRMLRPRSGLLRGRRRGSGSVWFAHGVGSYGVCGSAFRPTAERWVGTGVGLKPDPPRGRGLIFVGALSPGRRGSGSLCFAHGVGSYGGLRRGSRSLCVAHGVASYGVCEGFGVAMLRPRSGLLRGGLWVGLQADSRSPARLCAPP